MSNSETRAFQMHPAMLFNIIERQAGTLQKAILEGVMNSIDAKATKVEIEIGNDRIAISDDGRGFQNKKEIESCFEIFGLPHEESEGKTYGAFRMGRGQMFAFGKNTWSTGTFRMAVDFKKDGLDYDLSVVKEQYNGCRIEIDLYESLTPLVMDEVERTIGKWVRYAQIPVFINGKVVSKDPTKENWDIETNDAYIRLRKSGSLTVYNLGVFVCDFGHYIHGTAGEIVSKKQLRVNFARNDIQATCPVWRKIKPNLQETSKKDASNRKRQWNDDERLFMITQLIAGEVSYEEAKEYPLITDVTESAWTIDKFVRQVSSKYGNNVSVSESGSKLGDKIMQRRMAFILSDVTLDMFNVENVNQFLEVMHKIYCKRYKHTTYTTSIFSRMIAVKFEELSSTMKENFDIVPAKELTPSQELTQNVLKNASRLIASQVAGKAAYQPGVVRQIYIGKSEVARAWTDGTSYIAINASEVLSMGQMDMKYWIKLASLVAHEYCHGEVSNGSHVHSREFYETYHNLNLAPFIHECIIECENA